MRMGYEEEMSLSTRMRNGLVTLKASCKTKHTLNHNIQQECSFVFTQKSWKLVLCKNLHTALFIIAKTCKWTCPSVCECRTSRQWNMQCYKEWARGQVNIMEGVDLFRVYGIHLWNYHNETSWHYQCILIKK
jgi:hypothetical protein